MNPPITHRETQAWTIEIKGRYFVKFGKKDQVQTAWSMVGGKLFMCQGELKTVLDKLDTKKKRYTVKLVEVQEHSGLELRDYYSTSYQLRRMIQNADAVGPMIGCHEMATKISFMSTALVLMEKEFSNRHLKAISINVQNNTSKWVLPACDSILSLDERLKIFKEHKQLDAIANGEFELCGKGMVDFDWDVPF